MEVICIQSALMLALRRTHEQVVEIFGGLDLGG